MTPRFRTLAKPALFTAGLSLVAFGLAHVAFITWVVDRSEDPSLALRLGLMFAAPILVGAAPAAVSALLGAATWRAAWGTPLASARGWGVVMASALLPALALNLGVGPSGDSPAPWTIPVILVGVFLVPAMLGAWLSRSVRGLGAGAAALPVGATLSLFIQAEPLGGWVLPFVVSMFAIFLASGWLMARMTARAAAARSSPGAGAVP